MIIIDFIKQLEQEIYKVNSFSNFLNLKKLFDIINMLPYRKRGRNT